MKMFKITEKKKQWEMDGREFSLARNPEGTVKIWTDSVNDLAYATGVCHAHDRQMQMMMVRLIGSGKLSEGILGKDELVEVDKFFHHMGIEHEAAKDVATIDEETRAYLQAYCDGVNHVVKSSWRPFEFKTVGYTPEPYCIKDIIVIFKIMSFVGLAQTQGDMQKFIIQSIKNGMDIDLLKDLYSPHLDGITSEQIEGIKKLTYIAELIPESIKFLGALPTVKCSNNWVVSGKKTKSSEAIGCYDPHLEINRLPAIWYEIQAETNDNFYLGVGMPGIPGLIMGRNKDVSFGFTYGFMDMIDFFIEEVKDGKYFEDGAYKEFNKRVATIKPKKKNAIELNIFENDRGILETDLSKPTDNLEDGYYLSRAWSNHKNGAGLTPQVLLNLHHVKNVQEAREQVKSITISCNWLLSDKNGEICFQQSGSSPNRRNSGLFPLEGWKSENNWNGIRNPDELNTIFNPDEGVLATANQDLNKKDGPLTINLPMGSYRADRIRELLLEKDILSVADMKVIQKDLFSKQAAMYMELLVPFLDDDKTSQILKNWDLCYDRHSKGATVFETFHEHFLASVFGDIFGPEVWQHIVSETSLWHDFYHLFDRVLLLKKEDKLWFKNATKAEHIKMAFERTKFDHKDHVKDWGERQQVTMNNIFFDGKLPKSLRVDHGPIFVEGSRATVVQGQVFRAHGRVTTFCPGWRFITDMSTKEAISQLCGGARDRPYSKYYKNQVDDWLHHTYKTLRAGLNSI